MIVNDVTLLPEPDSANQPHHLAGFDGEIDTIDRFDNAIFGVEVGFEIFDFEQWLLCRI